MEKIPESTIEGKESIERFGHSIDVDIHFVRHAIQDKLNPEQAITLEGRENAREYGRTLEGGDAIKAYASPERRAIKTAEEIVNASPHGSKYGSPRIRAELNMSSEQMSKEFIQKWIAKVKEVGEEGTIDWYLKFGSEKPDEQTDSPRELAEGMAYLLQRYIAMGGRLYNSSKVDLINATHGVFPEALLREVLIWEKEGEPKIGFDSLTEIGGQFKNTEGVVFKTHRDDKGALSIKVALRGQEYGLDLGKVRELAESYKLSQREE